MEQLLRLLLIDLPLHRKCGLSVGQPVIEKNSMTPSNVLERKIWIRECDQVTIRKRNLATSIVSKETSTSSLLTRQWQCIAPSSTPSDEEDLEIAV